MAHKTWIGGTAYEIDGGKAMVDGTVYEIDHGTTLVDGTAYEVGFGPTFVPIVDFGTITQTATMLNLAERPAGWDACTHALINGVVYEATGALSGTAFAYEISGSDSVWQIAFSTTNDFVIISSHKEGTFTLQLGILA